MLPEIGSHLSCVELAYESLSELSHSASDHGRNDLIVNSSTDNEQVSASSVARERRVGRRTSQD